MSVSVLPSISTFILPSIFCIFILNFHLKRSDFNFVHTHFTSPKSRFAEEYLFYFLLFVPILILTKQWLSIVIVPVLCIIVSLLPRLRMSSKQRLFNLHKKIIPSAHYEWLSGLRRFTWLFIVFFLLSVFLSFLPTLSLVLCWFLSIVVMLFYFPYEPSLLISQQEMSANRFLYNKTIIALKYSFSLFVVPIGLYIIFNPQDYEKAILVFVICLINPQATIIRKYQQYQPHAQFGGNGIMLLFLQMVLFNPVVLLLLVLFVSLGYSYAVNNLKTYCHDKDQ
ncbi:MAG: hypothetical protein K0S32_3619 [Bacteroidetes bacterium]|jgi:hypothetical protein|nr:hypothetical protein [Bacteroidota bacterium]